MRTLYVYLQDTMADWEIGFLTAEINSKRFFKKDAEEIELVTVSHSKNPVRTMGGLTVTPDISISEIKAEIGNVLVLPGADTWADEKNWGVLNCAKEFLDKGLTVCAICGATVALANVGILDNRKHTSNGAGFLDMFCPTYKGKDNYVDQPAIIDGNLITAAATGSLEFAKLIIEKVDVFSKETIDAWYNYFSTGNANWFYALMQSVQ